MFLNFSGLLAKISSRENIFSRKYLPLRYYTYKIMMDFVYEYRNNHTLRYKNKHIRCTVYKLIVVERLSC